MGGRLAWGHVVFHIGEESSSRITPRQLATKNFCLQRCSETMRTATCHIAGNLTINKNAEAITVWDRLHDTVTFEEFKV